MSGQTHSVVTALPLVEQSHSRLNGFEVKATFNPVELRI